MNSDFRKLQHLLFFLFTVSCKIHVIETYTKLGADTVEYTPRT